MSGAIGRLLLSLVAVSPVWAGGPSLRDLARNSPDGQVRVEVPPEQPLYSNLAELVAASDLIVIATAEQNRCRLTRDGQGISTVYRMAVREVLLGRGETRQVMVEIPGGRVEFGWGGAEVVVPWFLPMTNHEEYLLFLTQGDEGVFRVTGGPQGVYGLAWDYVKVHSGRRGDPVFQYSGLEASDFVAMVKRELESPER